MKILLSVSILLLGLAFTSCTKSLVTLTADRIEGDPTSERGAKVFGVTDISITNATMVNEDNHDGSTMVFLKRQSGGGVRVNCVCESGGTNLNCSESCEIDPTGTSKCHCDHFGCTDCSMDIKVPKPVKFLFVRTSN